MSVLDYQTSTTGIIPNTTGLGVGMTQQLPVQIYLSTNDTLATVTTTGYLNKSRMDFQIPYNNGQMALVYTTDQGTVWLKISVSGTNYSLVAPTGAADVALPTIVDAMLYATSTGGALSTASGVNIFNGGNIAAGLSGTAGILQSFPATALKGYLALIGVANTGNTAVNISNVAYGQASTVSFADIGSAAGRFLVANTATPFVSGNFPKASGTGGLMVDSGIAVTALQLSANIKAAQVASLGGAGAGPLTVTAAGCASTSIVNVTVLASSNPVQVNKVVPGTGNFALTLSADPGAVLTIQYSMFIAAQ